MFDKYKDSFYKGNKIPKDILALLHGDLNPETILWDLDLSFSAVAVVVEDDHHELSELNWGDEYTLANDMAFFLEDAKIEYTDHEYFNKERGLILTVFELELTSKGQLVHTKMRWEIYRENLRQEMDF